MSAHEPAGHPAVSSFLPVSDARAMPALPGTAFDALEPGRKAREAGPIVHAQVRIDDPLATRGERADGRDPADPPGRIGTRLAG